MTDAENTFVLFEEFGGNPSFVSFQTIAPGTVCGNAYQNKTMELSCEGRPISAIRFANFGDSNGTCGALVTGSFQGRNDAISIVQHARVGKESCSIEASEVVFGSTNCDGVSRSRPNLGPLFRPIAQSWSSFWTQSWSNASLPRHHYDSHWVSARLPQILSSLMANSIHINEGFVFTMLPPGNIHRCQIVGPITCKRMHTGGHLLLYQPALFRTIKVPITSQTDPLPEHVPCPAIPPPIIFFWLRRNI